MCSGGTINTMFTPDMGDFVEILGSSLLREACMKTEREMAAVVRRAIAQASFEDMNIKVAEEVAGLCSDRCYAYEHIIAKPLPNPLPPALGIRIVDSFFRLLVLHGIVVSDTNPGNYLYNEGSDALFVLDFGNTHQLHEKQRMLAGRLLVASGGSANDVAQQMPELPLASCETVVKLMNMICGKQPLSTPGEMVNLLTDPVGYENVDNSQVSHMAIIFRAIVTLVISLYNICLLYTSPSPRDQRGSRMPSSA